MAEVPCMNQVAPNFGAVAAFRCRNNKEVFLPQQTKSSRRSTKLVVARPGDHMSLLKLVRLLRPKSSLESIVVPVS